ncbi:hypothetical protein [Cellulomonas hominis]|uniref:hypothetical protein n=1 Tax=Cellulomonas hominis TaxID=156981 RepID=UPI003D9B2A33
MDVAAAATYQQNHPEADVFVRPIQEWLRTRYVPSVDVIVGGPPSRHSASRTPRMSATPSGVRTPAGSSG